MGKIKKLPTPKLLACKDCMLTYTYYKRLNYLGKSPIRCHNCHIRNKSSATIKIIPKFGKQSNAGRHKKGHTTRGIHKFKIK